MDIQEQTDKLVLELRRGLLVLATLSHLGTEQYGYSLKQELADQGLEIDEGTLYPLLRRLEKQGLLNSEWKVEESRPRRYYIISEGGREVLRRLVVEWNTLAGVMDSLLVALK